MGVKLRVDDFPWTKRDERDKHNLDAFLKFQDVINEFVGGYWLLGVIPGNCGQDELNFLRHKTSGIRIGMHGIMHDESRANEFLPYLTTDDIERQLCLTRVLLATAIQQDVRVYMPPHNVVDSRTLTALPKAGFRAFTGGPETAPAFRNDFVGGIKYLHSQPPHEYGRSDEMLVRNSAAHLIRESADKDIWLTLHWTWETNIGLESLRRLLSEIGDSLSINDCRF